MWLEKKHFSSGKTAPRQVRNSSFNSFNPDVTLPPAVAEIHSSDDEEKTEAERTGMRASVLPSGVYVKTDGRSKNHAGGLKRRHHHSLAYKASIIDEYDTAIIDGGTHANCMATISASAHLGSGVLSRWVSQREEILKRAAEVRRKDLNRTGAARKKGLFPKMEQALYDLFQAKRKRGRKVTANWLCLNARRLTLDLYGTNRRNGRVA
jgi:hypothetical protein